MNMLVNSVNRLSPLCRYIGLNPKSLCTMLFGLRIVTKKMTRLPIMSIWVIPNRFRKEKAIAMTMIRMAATDRMSNQSLEIG